MRRGSVRKFNAVFLALAVWFSAIAFYPVGAAAQTQPSKTKSGKKENKKEKEKKPSQTQTTTSSNQPLSEKDDPSKIGSRKINSGSDKFFGWLGGSQEKEIAIGRQISLEVEQQAKLVEDPIITEYVNRVGQNIVLHSDAKIPFTIKVIDSDEVNAFALPGGFFYVNKGLILAADNESELAGVMAHEIAHVAARHAMENQGKLQAINYGALAGIIFGGPILSTVLQNTAGIGQALAFFKFSRGAEGEADKLGVQYLYAAGYDPTAMATMFEKLASKNKKKPGTLSKLFSSHPQSVERRDESLSLVARFAEKDEYVISTSEFQRVKAHLLRLSNAKAGVSSDIDDSEPGRPTLKRRQPEPDTTDSSGDSSSSSDKKDAPPQLKKRGEPQPSPSPEQ
ncbi:MAG: M48 family metalloprotease [Acidobacteria bacterium]|nr:M48 family metalloprotease [Acidobacteriota bacterium]